jgi:hypothetical protein
MLNRNSKTTIASRSVGMNGSKISRMFEGRMCEDHRFDEPDP